MKEDNRLFENYLEEHFCNVALNSLLFPDAPIGLRFELGLPDREVEDPSYFKDILFRAERIFDAVFEKDMLMILIVKRFSRIGGHADLKQGDEVLSKYMKDRSLWQQVKSMALEKHFDENDELAGITYQHTLVCPRDSVDYRGILKAVAHKDFAIEPYSTDSVFFINPHEHIMYSMYDDRGLDLVAERKEALSPIYRKYHSWILEYDKKRIDSVFC